MNEKNFYKVDKQYSITLNPIDKYQFFGKIDRYKRFKNFVYEQMLATKYRYMLYIEYSEPRGFKTQGYSGPRLHMHGTISFKCIKQIGNFLNRGYYDLTRWTSIDIDTIDDLVKWSAYCTKQQIIKNNTISNFCVITPTIE